MSDVGSEPNSVPPPPPPRTSPPPPPPQRRTEPPPPPPIAVTPPPPPPIAVTPPPRPPAPAAPPPPPPAAPLPVVAPIVAPVVAPVVKPVSASASEQPVDGTVPAPVDEQRRVIEAAEPGNGPEANEPNKVLIAFAVLGVVALLLFGLSRVRGNGDDSGQVAATVADAELGTVGSGSVAGEPDGGTPLDADQPVDDGENAADPEVSNDLNDFDAQQRIAAECRELAGVETVTSCLRDSISSGLLPAYYLGVELEHPECGVGELALGFVARDQLSDEDYTALITEAQSCFTGLIDSGAIQAFDVPAEYLRPECAESRNPWNLAAPDGEALYNRWVECTYG